MKLKFKQQAYQTDAVNAVVDCFAGQPQEPWLQAIASTRPRPSAAARMAFQAWKLTASRTPRSRSTDAQLLENIQRCSGGQNLPHLRRTLKRRPPVVRRSNLDVEMETGTGKTYCYIKTIFELNKRYGWTKFIVVVPSIAIREGVKKSFDITAEHFLETVRQASRAPSSTTRSSCTSWRAFPRTPGST